MSDEQRVRTMAGWVGVEISRSRVRTPGKAGYGLYRVRASQAQQVQRTTVTPGLSETTEPYWAPSPWTGYAYTLEQIGAGVLSAIRHGAPAGPDSLRLRRVTKGEKFVMDVVPTRWTPAYRGRRDLGEPGREVPLGNSLGEQPHDPEGCHAQGRPHLGPCCAPTAGAGLSDAAMQALNGGGKLVTEGTVQGRQRAHNQAFQARHKRERDWGLTQRHARKLSRKQPGGQGGDGSAPKT